MNRFLLLVGTAASRLIFPSYEAAYRTTHLPNPSVGTLRISGTSTTGGLCDPSVKQISGFFDLGEGEKKYFFWFFESRNDPANSPTVMWLTGGPGCSSQMALLAENGPCTVSRDGTQTLNNTFSWNNNANIFWVDQPPGTGFSEGDYDHDEEGVAEDMYFFLQALFKKYPEYNRNFYVFGESYAGHYIPAVTHKIFEMNNRAKLRIDLKGMGIGNGLTNPEEQYKWYPEMAHNSGTAPRAVSDEVYERMKASVGPCVEAIQSCNEEKSFVCNIAMFICNSGLFGPYEQTGLNPYDMRKQCDDPPLCYDFKNIGIFLNNPETQKALGVNKRWEECNMQVNMFFQQDFLRNFHQLIPPMLAAGIRVLIYAGDVDFICNWIGNKHWALNLDWPGKAGFNNAKDVPYKTKDGKDVGLLRTYNDFSFLQVFQAGHMVPMDKPEESLFMFEEFVHADAENISEETIIEEVSIFDA